MLNEPNTDPVPGGGESEARGAGRVGGDVTSGSHTSYIQVTPQEKEAIERVRRLRLILNHFTFTTIYFYKYAKQIQKPNIKLFFFFFNFS